MTDRDDGQVHGMDPDYRRLVLGGVMSAATTGRVELPLAAEFLGGSNTTGLSPEERAAAYVRGFLSSKMLPSGVRLGDVVQVELRRSEADPGRQAVFLVKKTSM